MIALSLSAISDVSAASGSGKGGSGSGGGGGKSGSGGGGSWGNKIRVKCEVRGVGERSKISVNIAGFRGRYVASVTNIGKVTIKSKAKVAVSRQVEFDFDSDPEDISQGATAIPHNFIVNSSVLVVVRNAKTRVKVAVAHIRGLCTNRDEESEND